MRKQNSAPREVIGDLPDEYCCRVRSSARCAAARSSPARRACIESRIREISVALLIRHECLPITARMISMTRSALLTGIARTFFPIAAARPNSRRTDSSGRAALP